MKLSRIVGLVVLVAVVAVVAWVLAARAGAFNTRYDAMVAKYASAPSKFIEVDGVRIHIRDEGTGPVVLMLHSSMMNLHVWDAWAEVLKTNHRVVRIDWPPYGLSVDNTGKMGTPHVSSLVEGVVQQLGLKDMVVVGSSSGATLSVVYAAQHPEQVRALALSVLPLKAPPTKKTAPTIAAYGWMHDHLFPNYYPKSYWRAFLQGLFADPSKVTDADVELFADTNNLQDGYARVKQYYLANTKGVWKTGAGGYASQVKAPVLLQWTDADPVLPVYLAPQAIADFSQTKVTLKHYRLGHYPMLEDDGPAINDLKAFIDGLPPIAAIPAAPVAAKP